MWQFFELMKRDRRMGRRRRAAHRSKPLTVLVETMEPRQLMSAQAAVTVASNAAVHAQGNVAHAFYRTEDGHIREKYFSNGAWRDNDLTAATKAPLAVGELTSYAIGSEQHMVFRDANGRVHELWFNGSWRHNDLTAASGNTASAAGDLFGYVENGRTQYVVFRGNDGHVYALSHTNRWILTDLAQTASAPVNAAGNPVAYTEGSTLHVVFRGMDGHIHELYRLGAGWRHNDLTRASGAPTPAVGDPSGYMQGSIQHVVYRGTDNHIHELWFSTSWRHNDLTTASGAPTLAAGNPSGYVQDNVQHVVYRGTDGHVHELYFQAHWRHNDLSNATATPVSASGDPKGFLDGSTQRVIFRGTDQRLHHLEFATTWRYENLDRPAAPPDNPLFKHDGYDYVPTVMYENGKYRMWWGGILNQNGIHGDYIFYSEARTPNGPWSTPRAVLAPTGRDQDFDGQHACDPSVIKIGRIYYMYYGGHPNASSSLPQTTMIGVATSLDGINWTRANNGLPIIQTRNYSPNALHRYGAGQPSAVYLNGLVYLAFHDSTAPAANSVNGAGIYVVRASNPLFTGPVEELLAPVTGRSGWVRRTSTQQLTGEYSLAEAFSIDWQYSDRAKAFLMSIHGVPGQSSVRVFRFDRDQNLIQRGSELRLNNVNWTEGPGVAHRPDGHSLDSRSSQPLPWKVFYSTGYSGQINAATWDLAFREFNLVLSQLP